MHTKGISISILTGALLAAGCSAPGVGEAGRDFELYYEDEELDAIEWERDNPDPGDTAEKFDLKIDRERVGARFAFGGETTRGFFQVFTEEFQGTSEATGDTTDKIDLYGAGGGIKGAPIVGQASSDIALMIPFRADLSFALGEESYAEDDVSVGYVELHGDVGFGAEWMGLRPSAGVAFSSIVGAASFEDNSPSPDPDEDYTLTGTNAGFFLDLLYKNEEFPIYGHIRALFGDYEGMTFGIGVKF